MALNRKLKIIFFSSSQLAQSELTDFLSQKLPETLEAFWDHLTYSSSLSSPLHFVCKGDTDANEGIPKYHMEVLATNT